MARSGPEPAQTGPGPTGAGLREPRSYALTRWTYP
jgi:hypothetical protein